MYWVKDFPGGPVSLTLCVSTAGSRGSIPDPGTKIPHASWVRSKRKKNVLG